MSDNNGLRSQPTHEKNRAEGQRQKTMDVQRQFFRAIAVYWKASDLHQEKRQVLSEADQQLPGHNGLFGQSLQLYRASRRVPMNQKFNFIRTMIGIPAVRLKALRVGKKALQHKLAIATATNGIEIEAENPRSEVMRQGSYDKLEFRCGVFLPVAGKNHYRVTEEKPIKSSFRLANRFDVASPHKKRPPILETNFQNRLS